MFEGFKVLGLEVLESLGFKVWGFKSLWFRAVGLRCLEF